MGEERKVYRVLVGKLKGKGPLGRMESEWILGRLAEVYSVIQLVKERDRWRAVVNTEMNLRVQFPRS
jgi:hypothetical protein